MKSNFRDHTEYNRTRIRAFVLVKERLACKFDTILEDIFTCDCGEGVCSDTGQHFQYAESIVLNWTHSIDKNDYDAIKRGLELLAWCRDEKNNDLIIDGYANEDID